MTLKRLLIQLKNENVKIGSAKGSSFFYCDKVSNKTFNEIGKISQKYYKIFLTNYQRLEYRNKHFDKYWQGRFDKLNAIAKPEYRQKILDNEKLSQKQKEEKLSNLEKRLKELPQKLKKLERQKVNDKKSLLQRLKKAKKLVDTFSPLEKRKVKETYQSISPDELGTLIIKIKGYENGEYWTILEYQDRDQKKKRKLSDLIPLF